MATGPFHVGAVMNVSVILPFPKLVRTFVPYSRVSSIAYYWWLFQLLQSHIISSEFANHVLQCIGPWNVHPWGSQTQWVPMRPWFCPMRHVGQWSHSSWVMICLIPRILAAAWGKLSWSLSLHIGQYAQVKLKAGANIVSFTRNYDSRGWIFCHKNNVIRFLWKVITMILDYPGRKGV